jgi:hypothetical protein
MKITIKPTTHGIQALGKRLKASGEALLNPLRP